MRKIKVVFIFMISLMASTTYGIEDWDFAQKSKNSCSAGGQRQMNICLSEEYEKSDRRLNDKYGELVNIIKNVKMADHSDLVKSQRAWIKFRDLECKFRNPPHNGSLYNFSQFSCLIDMTEKRIKDLERYISWG